MINCVGCYGHGFISNSWIYRSIGAKPPQFKAETRCEKTRTTGNGTAAAYKSTDTSFKFLPIDLSYGLWNLNGIVAFQKPLRRVLIVSSELFQFPLVSLENGYVLPWSSSGSRHWASALGAYMSLFMKVDEFVMVLKKAVGVEPAVGLSALIVKGPCRKILQPDFV